MDDINRQWRKSALIETGEREIPDRTFFNHKKAIADVFSINIKCDRTLRYYIENSDDIMGGQMDKTVHIIRLIRGLVPNFLPHSHINEHFRG